MYNKKKRQFYWFITILLIIFVPFISIGYSALQTVLNIRSEVASIVDYSGKNLSEVTVGSCYSDYTGQVTDSVGQTVTATNVRFATCDDKRNVIFGGFCWQVIRTTETGGTKLIYNGEVVNGKCESTRSTHKGIVQSNINSSYQNLKSSYLYASSFTYDTTNNTFTLVDPISATWKNSTYEDLIGKYTCRTTSDTCTDIYYVNGYIDSQTANLISYTITNTNYAQIGNSPFNYGERSPALLGYMFNKDYESENRAPGTNTYKYGNTFTYDSNTGYYTLSGTTQDISDWSTGYNTINNTHYTCWNSTGTCTTISYVNSTDSSAAFYFNISGGKSVSDILDEMLIDMSVNRYNSAIKSIIDVWYAQNLSSKTNMLEDTVYCNARNITNLGGWNPNGGSTTSGSTLQFKNNSSTIDLACPNETDQFAVANNKAKLTYPVALLLDEERYNINSSSLMRTGVNWWELSPNAFSNYYPSVRSVLTTGDGSSSYVYAEAGVRPVISLKSTTKILDGTGTQTNPWIIDELSFMPIIDTYNNRLKNTYLSDTYREKIKTITLEKSVNVPNNAVVSWDIGVNQNGNVMAYLMTNSNDNTMYDLYIQGDGDLFANENSYRLFYSMEYVDSINGLENLNTSNVTNMNSMFSSTGFYSSLFTLDLGNKFDTSNVTNMASMFYRTGYNNTSFTLDLGNLFDTSNVTNMNYMFYYTGYKSTVFTLDLGGKFDTSNVTDMSYMFTNVGRASTVFTLDLGDKFDTSNVTDMTYMFGNIGYNNTSFTFDLGDLFDTSNVTNMANMFSNIGYNSTIFTLDLGDYFDTSNVTDMRSMFDTTGYKSTVFTLDLGNNFDTSNVTNMNNMFAYTGYYSTVFTLNLGTKFDTSQVTNMTSMFRNTGYNNTSFTLDLGNLFDTSNVTDMSYMFSYTGRNSTVFTLDLGNNFDTTKVTKMNNMFSNTGYNSTAFTLNLGNSFYTSRVSNFSNMFSFTGYKSTVFTLDLGNHFDTSIATNMSSMFSYAGYSSPVFTLDLGNSFYTNQVTDMSSMFSHTGYSSTVFTLNLESFVTNNVVLIRRMFESVGHSNDNLELDISTFVFTNTSVVDMFKDYKASQIIWVRDTSQRTLIIAQAGGNLSTDNVLIKS